MVRISRRQTLNLVAIIETQLHLLSAQQQQYWRRQSAPHSPTILTHLTPECPACIAKILAEGEASERTRRLLTVIEKSLHIPESNHKFFMKAKDCSWKISQISRSDSHLWSIRNFENCRWLVRKFLSLLVLYDKQGILWIPAKPIFRQYLYYIEGQHLHPATETPRSTPAHPVQPATTRFPKN